MQAPTAAVDGAAITSLIFAALLGATAPPGMHPGAAHGFLAALVAAVGVALLARFTGRHWTLAAAVITVSVAALVVGGIRMFWPVPGQRIAVAGLIAVLVAARVAPTFGLWMARVPRQSFRSITGRDIFARAPGQPADTLSPVVDAPEDVTLRGEQVGAFARRSNRVLLGALAGIAVVELAASIAAIDPGRGNQWPFIAMVAVVALILVMRARALRDRRHAVTMVCGAALSLLAIPAHYGLAAAPSATATGLWSAGAVVAVALAALVAGAVIPSHLFSEPIREAVEYLEYVLVALVVPFAVWAIGLLHYVRYH
jgi:type VII secretion integral membrane protein EccD